MYNISKNIADKIGRLPNGYVFTAVDFDESVNNIEAVIKALNRIAANGKIIKLSKGKYYKQENSGFGNILPQQYQIVKDYLVKDRKIIGYLTGLSIYNSLGLTTQVSNIIQIGRNTIRPPLKRGIYNISFILQKNSITEDNIPLLQILDSIRFIKKIPDKTPSKASERLFEIIKELKSKDIIQLIKLSLKYPPSARALLGVLLENANYSELADNLRLSLNPVTIYKINGINKLLKFAEKWNIK